GTKDLLNPGAALPTAQDLTIDYASSLELRVVGTVSGDPANSNIFLTAGPVTIAGSASFAMTRQTVDVDTDGNGTADLIGATLDGGASSGTDASGAGKGGAALKVSGGPAPPGVAP